MLNDRFLGVMALLFSAFLAWFGAGLEAAFSYEPVGPRAFPLLLSALIGLCGLVLTWRAGNQVDPNPPGVNLRILLMVGILAFYAAGFVWFGFILSTAIMTAMVGRLFGGSWMKSTVGGVAMSFLFYVLFDRVLDVVLPAGLLGAWL